MKRLLLAVTMLVPPLAGTPAAAFTFDYTGSIVSWTATASRTYEIVAVGAQGGAGKTVQSFSGGLGALIGGYFTLSSGDVLQLAVGGMGADGFNIGGGGGGGYSGGQGGTPAGGGRGSFNADTLTGWAQAGIGAGNGYITINLVEEVSTPEPGSAALSVLGLLALGAIRRRR